MTFEVTDHIEHYSFLIYEESLKALTANDVPEFERRLSFQQSLPDLARPNSPLLRNVKSLSDISLFPSSTIPYSRSITSNSCSMRIPNDNEKPFNYLQKNQNICEWLQKLEMSSANSETDSLNSFSLCSTNPDEKVVLKKNNMNKV
uniref:Uncharacterized protein n=1 Tax=Acrobeloides nanus TaxID=290746 RepID=A0A914EPR4_9BILA